MLMNKYELLYIVPVKFTETEIEGIIKKTQEMVTAAGCQISSEKNLGKIKLAYPIDNIRYGYYILVYFDAEPEVINELDNKFRLTEEILRYQFIKALSGAETKNYEVTSYQAPDVDEDRKRREVKRKEQKLTPSPSKAPEVTKPAEPVMSPEELDKRLDDILDKEITEKL